MNHRQNRRALYRAEEETTSVARHEVNDWFKQRGEDFWHSVWKRIENSQPRNEERRQMRGNLREAPRDYAVGGDVRG